MNSENIIESIEESPLYRIANPRSIVFFGASNNPNLMGTNQFRSLLEIGFEGPVYPVHPKDREVFGLKAYKSVLDLPETPDLAVIVIPTQAVSRALDECGQKGIKQAIIVSAGFKELGGEGVAMEQELVRIADRYGIRFLGPNCIGVTNPYAKVNPTPFRYQAKPGFIGMGSQSGSFVTQMFNLLRLRGLGFSTAFSIGNAANIDLVDCMEYLAACPHTKVIALYIEGIKRGRDFVRTARAITAKKPIVAFYVGGSETGSRAGFSHTGAMAGPDRLYDGIFRQCGIIRAQSITELFDFCSVLGTLPSPKSGRTILLTNSGGPGAAAADACGRVGLEMPPISEETLEKIAPFLPPTATTNNPIDLTFHKDPLDYYSEIPGALLDEDNADMLLTYFLMPTHKVRRTLESMGVPQEKVVNETAKMIDSLVDALAKRVEASGKPVIGYTFRSLDEPMAKGFIERGIPVFSEPARAAKAMRALVDYGQFRAQALENRKMGSA